MDAECSRQRRNRRSGSSSTPVMRTPTPSSGRSTTARSALSFSASSRRLRSLPGWRGNHQQYHSSRKRERRTNLERSRRPEAIPREAEQQRRRQRSDADREVVPPERRASTIAADEVGHHGALGTLREPEEHAVREEQRPRVPRLRGLSKGEIHRPVDRPSGENERPASNAIRQYAAWHA